MANEEPIEERIGRLADTAENYLQYGIDGPFARLAPAMRIDAMKNGLQELRDSLRALAIEQGADPETWAF